MAAVKVIDYWAGWDIDGHFGTLTIRTEDFGSSQMTISNPAEFSAVVDLLRNEKPLTFDKTSRVLITYNEPPGEGEA
jgi:hypothetical protein